MPHGWMIDVLTDLKAFARTNGMEVLAEQLDDATLVAAAEIATLRGRTAKAERDAGKAGTGYRFAATGKNP